MSAITHTLPIKALRALCPPSAG